MTKILIVILLLSLVFVVQCDFAADCSSQEAEIEQLEQRLAECEAQECECPECPECPQCPEPPEDKELVEFGTVYALRNWLEADDTDLSWDGNRNKLAYALQRAALDDGYLMSVYPFKKGCPGPKHHLLNFTIIKNEMYVVDPLEDTAVRYGFKVTLGAECPE